MANFNYSRKKDYKLQESMTNELINLYGIPCKILLAEKINKDDLVFGDYSHLKTTPGKSYEVYGLPETSETWDDVGINFSEFGMLNNETVRIFISRKSINKIFDNIDEGKGFKDIIGNLVVLPNNRIMEITDLEFEVPGANNLFVSNDVKNVYKFTLVTYNNKLINEVESTEITPSSTVKEASSDYETLNNYFDELASNISDVDTAAEVTLDENTNKPVIASDEDSVFGRF